MDKTWTPQDMLNISRMFMPACTLIAAGELGLFDALKVTAVRRRRSLFTTLPLPFAVSVLRVETP